MIQQQHLCRLCFFALCECLTFDPQQSVFVTALSTVLPQFGVVHFSGCLAGTFATIGAFAPGFGAIFGSCINAKAITIEMKIDHPPFFGSTDTFNS
jgi:hypothetical protein